MPRDKHPTLPKTCLICRDKIIGQIHINCADVNFANKSGVLQWQVLCVESLCMLFGIPENHPFISVFVGNGNRNGQLCNPCFQDISNVHHVFWQLQNLEQKLTTLQMRLFGRLRINYDAMPVATVFARMSEEAIINNLKELQYNDIVKILFEKIKDAKGRWPQPLYISRWKQACANASIAQVHSEVDRKRDGISSVEDVVKSEASLSTESSKDDRPSSSLLLSSKPICNPGISPAGSLKDDAEDQFILPDSAPSPMPSDVEKREDDTEWSTPATKKQKKQKLSKKQESKKGKKLNKPTMTGDKRVTRYLCVEDPETCDKTYSAKKHLLTHIQKFHKGMQFACEHEDCSKRFENAEKLQTHKEKTHEKKRITEICETCGLELPRGDLKKHYYMRHVGVKKFRCDICSMDFDKPLDLASHEQLHRDAEFPFICVVCNNLFTNSMDLKSHVNSNHLSSGLKCNICGVMKHNDYLLQRHMKLHDRTKRFVCHCGKSFATNAYLTYHVEHFHDNAGKKYPCEVCGKPFLHMKNVLRHMITHKEEKPYKCKICLKQFNYSHLLKKHEEIHSGTKNYGCDVCGKRFRQEQNLTQHMRSHRPKPEKQGIKKESSKSKTTTVPKVQGDEEAVPVIVQVEEAGVNNIPVIVGVGSARMENAVPIVVDGTAVNEGVPVIVEIKGDDHSIKHDSEIGELIIAEAVESQHGSEFVETHGTQLISASTLPTHSTTTVVFVTADPNFHWIT